MIAKRNPDQPSGWRQVIAEYRALRARTATNPEQRRRLRVLTRWALALVAAVVLLMITVVGSVLLAVDDAEEDHDRQQQTTQVEDGPEVDD
jgi:type VI protein secretion system component VasK